MHYHDLITSIVLSPPDSSISHTSNETLSSVPECPHVWTLIKQREFFLKEYLWLIESDGKLGCRTSKNVSTLDYHAVKGIGIGKKWIAAKITTTGPKDSAQKRFRNKIYKHARSKAIKSCLHKPNTTWQRVWPLQVLKATPQNGPRLATSTTNHKPKVTNSSLNLQTERNLQK